MKPKRAVSDKALLGCTLAGAAILGCGFFYPAAARAQGAVSGQQVTIMSGGAPVNDLAMGQYQAFEQFQDKHPEVINELTRNPRLLHSEAFMAHNPEWRDFLDSHPELREDLYQDPGNFLPLGPAALGSLEHPASYHAHHAARHGMANSNTTNATTGENEHNASMTNTGSNPNAEPMTGSMAKGGRNFNAEPNPPMANAGPNPGGPAGVPAANAGAANPDVPPNAPAANGAPGAPVSGAPGSPTSGGANPNGAAR